MTEQPDTDAAAESFEQALPLISAAIEAQLAGDYRGLTGSLLAISRLGEAAFYASLAVFAEAATHGVPRGAKPGGTWIPRLFVGNPPRQVEPETSPAAAFALRFLAATLNRDEDMRLALWRAFVAQVTEDGRDEDDAARQLGATLVLMVQLAARGVLKQQGKQARTHQHPNAGRRTTRRPHPRDQRKR